MPVADGVPVMAPVEESIDMPVGSAAPVHVNTAPGWVSVAEGASEVAVPVRVARLAWAVTTTELLMVQVKAADPEWPVLSRATSTTAEEPGVVGVPLTTPVVALIDKPAGRPVADHVRVAPGSESVALGTNGVMAVPVVANWVPGLPTVTVDEMPQVNEVEPAKACPSVAVMVTG